MKYAFRVLCSVLILALFGVLAAVVVAAVAAGVLVAFRAGGRWAVGVDIAVIAILAVAGVRLLAAWRRPGAPLPCVPVTSSEQPVLWVEINRVAEGLGIRAPDELWLVPGINVAACQRRTWLGLRPGARRLHLGLPLVAGLTERQFCAVITAQMFRRFGPALPGRVVDQVSQLVGAVLDPQGEHALAARIFGGIGGMYLAVSGPVSRRHQVQADRLGAGQAGNDAMAGALGQLPLLGWGWDVFVDGYTKPAATVGRRPRDVFAGFASFMADPDRRAQLTEQVGAPGSEQAFAPHGELWLPERLAAVGSLPEDGMHDVSRPAMELVREAEIVIGQVEESLFGWSGLAPATLADVVPAAARAACCEDALELARLGTEGGLGSTLSVATLVDLMSFGLAEEMVRPMFAKSGSAEDRRLMAGRLVTGFLATAAIESGTASFKFSWVSPRLLVDDKGVPDNLAQLVDTALADQSEVPALVRWLASHRVGRELEMGGELGGELGQASPDAPAVSMAERLAARPAASSDESPSEDPTDAPGPLVATAPETLSI